MNRNVVVDTRYTPRASLLQYVDGSEWEVTYYSQVLGKDSEPAPHDIQRSPTDQQYVQISNMEIKVTSPLTSQQDEAGRSFDVTGAATVYPHIRPNKYDMFIADIGDGRAAMFAITGVTQKTYFKESYCEIQYELVDYVDSKPQIANDLRTKSQRRTVFVKEFLHYGQNPQLLEGEFQDHLRMSELFKDLTAFYFHDFYSQDFNTLLIPGQAGTSYDPFLTESILNMFATNEVPTLQYLRRPYVLSNKQNGSISLWTALMQLNHSYMHMAFRYARLLSTVNFRSLPEISGIYFTGINYLVCPGDERHDVDAPYEPCPTNYGPGMILRNTKRRWSSLAMYIPSGDLKGFKYEPSNLQELPDIVPVTVDEYYVLSGAFYRGNETLASKLEVLVKQAMKQEPIDKVTLLQLCENCMKWPNLERYYYIPLLFVLMRVALRTN